MEDTEYRMASAEQSQCFDKKQFPTTDKISLNN